MKQQNKGSLVQRELAAVRPTEGLSCRKCQVQRRIVAFAAFLLLLCGCGKQPEQPPAEPVPEEPVQVEVPAEKETKNGLVRQGDSLIFYVEDEPQTFEPGVREIEGKAYLILEDGTICSLRNQVYDPGADQSRYYLEDDSSLRRFEEGFAELPEGTYLVAQDGYEISGLTAEVATVDGAFYAIDGSGCLMQLESGVHELFLDGVYIAQEGTAALIKPEQGLLHWDGELYYVEDMGFLAKDTAVGYLTFGADGTYTSGNAELDAAVRELIRTCVTEDMTDTETVLRAVYDHMRDNYRYLSGDLYEAGTTDWAEDCAMMFLQRGKGNCYCWAATLMYCARQLGYQAYVVGGWESNPDNVHAWTMIDWPDGETYLFDAELEYAYWYMFKDKPQIDMFKASSDDGLLYNGFAYYFP